MTVVRFAVGTLVAAAVAATLIDTVARTGAVNPFNFFGYFTVQSNLLLAAVLLLSGLPLRGPWAVALPYARAAVTVYVVIVGLVYATLLAPLGQAGGVPVPWANTVLHIVTPIYVVLDWALVPDRPPLDWRRIWVILLYPAVWVAVVLIRGASDGWVPYPFLAPTQGYVVVAVYCLVIFAIALAIGALAWWVTRWRGPLPGLSGSRRS